MKAPPCPRDLGQAGRKLWKAVTGRYQIEAHHEGLLLQAARAADTAESARVQIEAEGLTVKNNRGELRAHPLLAVQRDAQRVLGYLLKTLGIRDDSGPHRPGR